MSIEDKAAEIARGLSERDRVTVLEWERKPKQLWRYSNVNPHHFTNRLGLVDWQWDGFEEWADGEITPLGLAVASHLKDPRS